MGDDVPVVTDRKWAPFAPIIILWDLSLAGKWKGCGFVGYCVARLLSNQQGFDDYVAKGHCKGEDSGGMCSLL